jgi:NADH:ubiquinone oxidoreductase subunit E
MNTTIHECPCSKATHEEKLEQILTMIEHYKDQPGNLIQILHMAQGIYGYLPLDLQEVIANTLELPLSEVYGVVTFYSYFSTTPRGEYTIRVCLGTACYVRGGQKIVDRFREILGIDIGGTTKDMKFTLEIMRCLGACGLAPAITINDKVYKQVNPDKLEKILEHYY